MNQVRTLMALAFVVASFWAMAQSDYVHRVIIMSEGPFGGPVEMGHYDPVTTDYVKFDSIPEARFGSDVIVDGNEIFAAIDTLVIVYDANTYQELRRTTVHGVRKLAIWNNQLLLTRGEVGGLPSYFQAYNKNTLTLDYELTTTNGPGFSAEGIVIWNDSAYVAINNAYDPDFSKWVGKIGIVDLDGQSYAAEVDLGADGVNPDNLMIDGNDIYTLNNKDWTGASVTSFNPATRGSTTSNLPIATGCGTSVFASGHVYYQEAFTNDLRRWEASSQSTVDTLVFVVNGAYGMTHDHINGLIYIGATDFTSYGRVYIMREDGIPLSLIHTGVSPGNIALDIRKTSSVADRKDADLTLRISPNPVTSSIQWSGTGEAVITDILGNMVKVHRGRAQMDVSDLTPGMYFISTPEGVGRFAKQ